MDAVNVWLTQCVLVEAEIEPHGVCNDFLVNLDRVHACQPSVIITGGTAVAPLTRAGRTISVRGQQATAATTREGTTLVWREDGQRYMVASDLTLPDLRDLTSRLRVVDLSTFRSRLQPR